MTTEENKAVVRRFIEEVLNNGDVDVADEVIAVDFVPRDPFGRGEPGIDAIKRFAAAQREAAPDWRITIEDVIAEGDKVVVRATGRGAPQREFYGIPASDRQLSVPWIAIYRVVDGKIVERWSVVDMLGLLQQAGAM